MPAKADREKMGRLSGIIQSYQNASLVFEPMLPEVVADIKAGYESTVEDSYLTCGTGWGGAGVLNL